MAGITGEITASFGGRSYRLRLTMLGLDRLQERYGETLGGLLDGTAGKYPRVGLLVAIVEQALQRGGDCAGMTAEEIADLADDLATADHDLATRVLAAAFPEASEEAGAAEAGGGAGNGDRAG